MKVVITGVNGFVGQHLVTELVAHGHTVIGVGLGDSCGQANRLLEDYLAVDLRRCWPVLDCDAIVHLAGLSQVRPSFDAPQSYIEANSAPVTNLGEMLLRMADHIRVVVVSTGAVYQGPAGSLWNEDAPIVPSSPYIVSKLVIETQCLYYRHRGLDIVVMRPFNHFGPGQKNGFLLPDLIHGVKKWVETGSVINVGNLNTRRDYTDVRDVVRSYRLAIEAPYLDSTVLNVCSGRSVSGNELLAQVAGLLTPGRYPDVCFDQARLRPQDPHEIRGDNSRIHEILGWQPSIPIAQTVRDVVASAMSAC